MSTLLTDLEKAGQTTETNDPSKKWTAPGDHQSIGRERKTKWTTEALRSFHTFWVFQHDK
jgi:hypothetical protein